jgi:hypothetical protein
MLGNMRRFQAFSCVSAFFHLDGFAVPAPAQVPCEEPTLKNAFRAGRAGRIPLGAGAYEIGVELVDINGIIDFGGNIYGQATRV